MHVLCCRSEIISVIVEDDGLPPSPAMGIYTAWIVKGTRYGEAWFHRTKDFSLLSQQSDIRLLALERFLKNGAAELFLLSPIRSRQDSGYVARP
jgi:hypothetical protein